MSCVISLDLAGRTGLAIRYDDGSVKTCIWTLTRGNLGGRRSPRPMARLWARLVKLSQTHDIQAVIFEEAFARGDAKYRLDSLQHAAILWCCLNGVTWRRMSPAEWKRATCGKGNASRAEYAMVAQQKYGSIRMWTDDQAAAVLMLEYAGHIAPGAVAAT